MRSPCRVAAGARAVRCAPSNCAPAAASDWASSARTRTTWRGCATTPCASAEPRLPVNEGRNQDVLVHGASLAMEDQRGVERAFGGALEQAGDELDMLLLLRRHLARERAQRRIGGADQHPLEEGERPLLALQGDGKRLVRR